MTAGLRQQVLQFFKLDIWWDRYSAIEPKIKSSVHLMLVHTQFFLCLSLFHTWFQLVKHAQAQGIKAIPMCSTAKLLSLTLVHGCENGTSTPEMCTTIRNDGFF